MDDFKEEMYGNNAPVSGETLTEVNEHQHNTENVKHGRGMMSWAYSADLGTLTESPFNCVVLFS